MADDTRRTAYTTAHIDDLPVEIDDERPTTEWKPVRRFFGIGSFGTNLARATQPGDVLTYDHTEVVAAGTRHEELFLIVSGHATYRVDGKEIDAPAGTFLYVPDPAPVQPSPGAPSALGRRRRQRVRQFVVALMHAGAHLFLLDALELGGDHLLLLVAQDALGEREEHRVLLVDVQAQQVAVQREVLGDGDPCGLALVDVGQRRVDGTDRRRREPRAVRPPAAPAHQQGEHGALPARRAHPERPGAGDDRRRVRAHRGGRDGRRRASALPRTGAHAGDAAGRGLRARRAKAERAALVSPAEAPCPMRTA